MGIDLHTLNFLIYAHQSGDFKTTATIGRQEIHVPKTKNPIRQVDLTRFCEPLLENFFGSHSIDSFDNSPYEGATYIVDMNSPIPKELERKYDTVIDGGCLEHIFNIPQALKNCSLLLKAGGQIIHVLPANNFCGHGFWQFSPELFFSLYSEENGYKSTEIFLASNNDNRYWYKVKKPRNGQRVNIYSSSEISILVRTILTNEAFKHNQIQQSDYVAQWNATNQNKTHENTKKLRNFFKKIPFASKIYNLTTRYRFMKINTLGPQNPNLTQIKIAQLLS